ncbi:MAG TPA: hypothetical protein VFL13_13335 [Candidatus Baltobacteraceae bacterium]|nr:hypothetical protein [Candidatus Baltobacteraceae bacterium]
MISDTTARSLETLDRREQQAAAAFTPAYVVTAQANGAMSYTNDRQFAMRGDTLVDASGNTVLGYADADAPLSPLRVDPIDAALGYAAQARVFADGTFGYDRAAIDPQTGFRTVDRTVVGRLALARFPNGAQLRSVGLNHVVPQAGVAPHIAPAGDTAFQDRALDRLQDAYLAFDALRAAGHAEGSLDKTAMDLLK